MKYRSLAAVLMSRYQGPDFQKILSQTYDKILVQITVRHS